MRFLDSTTFILSSPNFASFLKHDGKIKPIWVFTRDDHDGLRFLTTSKSLIKFLKENDVDFIVAVCNASGLSAYHFIERRMPTLKRVNLMILPHDSYGSHLDGNGKTIDGDKELQISRRLAKRWLRFSHLQRLMNINVKHSLYLKKDPLYDD